jgi:carbonic anhydrase/acetyltransferase-like protein (isoleucine patch superfamily)
MDPLADAATVVEKSGITPPSGATATKTRSLLGQVQPVPENVMVWPGVAVVGDVENVGLGWL